MLGAAEWTGITPNGYPFRTIGEANINHDFSNAKLVEVDLYFRVGIIVDSGVNSRFINYSKERIRVTEVTDRCRCIRSFCSSLSSGSAPIY